ncbi:hypothetical protein IMSAGC008_01628 [Muribaculaceae bacterium]|nr:hypothetical protein IMSAGC008_01628 [Muribaculaceae bacterium]
MRLEKFERGRGAHFRRNDACKVIFYRNNVDGGHCFAAYQFEIAFETLVFFAFPVEIHADYNVFEFKYAFGRCGFKYYFCIFVAVPHYGAVGGYGGSLRSFDEAVL